MIRTENKLPATMKPNLNFWAASKHTVLTKFVMTYSSFEHEPIKYGLQAVAGFLLDEYLSKSDELRHNFTKIGLLVFKKFFFKVMFFLMAPDGPPPHSS